MRIRALGVARRCPRVPTVSPTEAIEAARPAQVVATGEPSCAMVSTRARPESRSPPGELMRNSIGSPPPSWCGAGGGGLRDVVAQGQAGEQVAAWRVDAQLDRLPLALVVEPEQPGHHVVGL